MLDINFPEFWHLAAKLPLNKKKRYVLIEQGVLLNQLMFRVGVSKFIVKQAKHPCVEAVSPRVGIEIHAKHA
ncbi:MAG: hypothetical protein ACJA1U_002758 [Bermanella sp.]|jgi:hypothetical protein